MKIINRVFKISVAVFCSSYLFFSFVPHFATSAKETAPNTNSDADRKNELLSNYPPNLSEMQEIGLGVFSVNQNGEITEQKVRPDCHFRGDDGKEYLVFYNNHIRQLQEVLYTKLKKHIDEHTFIFAGKSYALNSVAKGQRKTLKLESFECTFEDIFWNKIEDIIEDTFHNPFGICSAIAFFQKDHNKIRQEAIALAEYSGKLVKIINQYGEQLDNSNTPCMVIVPRDLSCPIVIKN